MKHLCGDEDGYSLAGLVNCGLSLGVSRTSLKLDGAACARFVGQIRRIRPG
jgi:hypothetical protein